VFDHVLIIVLENQDFEPVWQHPYMHTLATRGSLLAQFHGVRHPSYPNYLAMVGGQAFDIADAVQQELNARTIADLLEEKQLTWTQYAEGFPGQCFLVVVMRATPESMCLS
jgi:Phosphoesterase family